MSKFTPGPWRVSGSRMTTLQGTDNLIICHGDNDTFSPMIAEIYSDGGRLPNEANAQAIAALPELVEALKLAYANLGSVATSETFGFLRQQIKQALAKVEGKEGK